MAAKPKGSLRRRASGLHARIFIGDKKRVDIPLPTCGDDEEVAGRRAEVLSRLASQLRAAGLIPQIKHLLERAGAAREEDMPTIRGYIDSLCKNGVDVCHPGQVTTFRTVGEDWTSGRLAARFPDFVREKRSADTDRYRLERHIYPHVGNIPIASFTLEDAERVMAALPTGPTDHGPRRARGLEGSSRGKIAWLVGRVMNLAVYPLKLIKVSPIPRGWLPKKEARKALVWLYPDEDALLLGCTKIPLGYRVLYGFLAREGPRVGEALRLDKIDVDLKRGTISLDENKTDDPRMWAANRGVVTALERWFEIWKGEKLFDVGEELADDHLADKFREHLKLAGITRPVLFERNKARRPIRPYDLRATFVTLSLAHGKTEKWVSDRTGHRSSDQIATYDRAARTAAELSLPELTPLDQAIPELRGCRLRLVSG